MRRTSCIAALLATTLVVQAASAQTKEGDEVPPAPFDSSAAKAAITAVGYLDCGTGGVGKVLVTFGSNGAVARVKVTEGAYADAVRLCIEARYAKLTVPAFSGEAEHSVKFTITLPAAAPPPAPPAAAAPPPAYYYAPGPTVIKYEEGMPVYPGYHIEERSRTGLVIGGSITLGVGALVFLLGVATNDDRQLFNPGPVYMVIGGIAAVTGAVMLLVGVGSKRKMIVRDGATLVVPVANKDGGGFAFVGTF